jgi:hypothetical protein
MRAALITACLLLALAGCDRSADDHLRAAGDQAKGAVADVGKAVDASVPVVKDTGRRLGDDIRQAGHKAGQDIRDAGDKARDDGRAARDRNDNPDD